jgi:hypothetical protein
MPSEDSVDFKLLFLDPKLKELFLKQAEINDGELEEYIKGDMVWEWMERKEVIIVHNLDNPCYSYAFGVYVWGERYFSEDPSQDLIAGPFDSPEEAAEAVSQFSLSEFADTHGLTFGVKSSLPAEQALEIVSKLIHVGGELQLNGVLYRRASTGYLKVG